MRVRQDGTLFAHPWKRADPEAWTYALAHALLHLGFSHFQDRHDPNAWELACEISVFRFLLASGFGSGPVDPMEIRMAGVPEASEDELYRWFCEHGSTTAIPSLRITGSIPDFFIEKTRERRYGPPAPDFEDLLVRGIQASVADAIERVHEKWHPVNIALSANDLRTKNMTRRARQWFIDRFPLIGGIVASFDLIVDLEVCRREDIAIAAVSPYAKEIYVNPLAVGDEEELKFVVGHEIFHAALRHDARCLGRDPYLWNVACDYVINGWLVEMNVGSTPAGLLYDPELKGLSSEAVYDRIARDLRRLRKLSTLRGRGTRDIIDGPSPSWWMHGEGIALDEFYRSALQQGLNLHLDQSRGIVPAGLSEEIRALSQPPIAWDVELAQWLDHFFPSLEQRRTYARANRRQSAVPDIPLPRYVRPDIAPARTFGVIVDTSGSMSRRMLGDALGAITSYALARDVPRVRIVSCDAAAYDHGYLAPEVIGDRLVIKGRGGTVLQPGIDLIEQADDFPKSGPILIVTDGVCDVFKVKRDHAVLLPRAAVLGFVPKGPLFRMS